MSETQNLARNLALFSDPATPSSFEVAGNKARVRIIRSGEERDYLINLDDMRVEARHSNQKFHSIKSLLASEEFADLRSFAATQSRVLSSKALDQLIEPAGVIDPDGRQELLSLERGRQIVEPIDSDAVRILLVDGPAGVGKTSFIERMVYERACNTSSTPILHITSKGRRLSNLPDAIGKTASDLDARFRAEQVPVLARLNALQVAIDGFDELVQPDGYGNAWGALKDFIRQMGRGGPIILAGRDTFFDQQDVHKQFKSLGANVEFTMVRLREIDEGKTREWLVSNGWSSQEVSSPRVKSFFQRSYTRRPFFLAQIADLKSFENLPAELGSPQAILIDRLLDREAGILSSGLPKAEISRIKASLQWLCEELAVDMADREAESVSVDFLEFVCEYTFEAIANADELSALIRKVGSLAVLESTERKRECKFPHTEVQNHFLARALHKEISKGGVAPSMRSASYGTDLVEAFADVVRTADEEGVETVIAELEKVLKLERYAYRLSSNAGALLIACLVRSNASRKPIVIDGIAISEARVFEELSAATLRGVTIGRFDARGADLSHITFENCQIGALMVDQTTRFGSSLPEVATLQIHENGGIKSKHDAGEISTWLDKQSASPKKGKLEDWRRGQDLPLVKLFDRICRRFMRQHYIRNSDGDDGYFLIRERGWEEIRRILEAEGRLTIQDAKGVSGVNNEFYHVAAPEKLLSPEGDDQAMKIRLSVIAKAEELAA